MDLKKPLNTICAQVKGGHHALVSAALVGVGGRAGDSRPRGVDEPTATITSKYDTAVVSALLVDAAHSDISPSGVKRWGQGHKDIELPLGTIAASGNQALATAFLASQLLPPDFPTPVGGIRRGDAEPYESLVSHQIEAEIERQGAGTLDELIRSGDVWTVHEDHTVTN